MAKNRRMLTRRQFVQATGSVAAAGLAGGARAQAAKPNIIFIMADDLGYADVSCYGQRDYTTPNVDRLALEGMRFTQAYSNSPVCSPTRVALMTGRYQYRLAAGLEEPINADSPKDAGLPPSHPTFASIIKKAGYATELIGKWHLGFLPDFSPLKSGYDRFFGFFGGTADYFNHGSKSRTPLYEQEVRIDRNGYMTNLLGDRAAQSIEAYARAKQPFLISLHFNAPHYPWIGPDDEEESKRVKEFIHYEGGSQKTYAAMVQSMDLNVGKVLQMLDVLGIAGNTLVVFTSDNGGERFSKIWPFSGMKQELLEGGVRIPAIVRWPGRLAAGQVTEQVAATMDWLPTLLAAAGETPDAAFPPDGENLLPVVSGRERPHARKLFFRFRPGGQRAVREGDWKYLRIAGNEFLFDVVKDPRERANLKGRHADVFERLKKDWETWNATMLPEKAGVARYRHPGDALADHYGLTNPK